MQMVTLSRMWCLQRDRWGRGLRAARNHSRDTSLWEQLLQKAWGPLAQAEVIGYGPLAQKGCRFSAFPSRPRKFVQAQSVTVVLSWSTQVGAGSSDTTQGLWSRLDYKYPFTPAPLFCTSVSSTETPECFIWESISSEEWIHTGSYSLHGLRHKHRHVFP